MASGSAEGSIGGAAYILTGGITAWWKYKIEIDAKGLTGNSSHQILHFLLQRKQRLFWGIINNDKTFANLNRYEPTFNSIPWESVPGGVESLADRLDLQSNTMSGGWSFLALNFLGYNYNFTLANRFGFVPLVSSLDIANPNYTATTIFDITANVTTPSGTFIAGKFVAQETFSAFGSTQYNEPHTTFTARNSQWIYNEMEDITQPVTCKDYCYVGLSISGPESFCDNATFSVPEIPGVTYTWNVNNSFFINTSANNNEFTLIRRR